MNNAFVTKGYSQLNSGLLQFKNGLNNKFYMKDNVHQFINREFQQDYKSIIPTNSQLRQQTCPSSDNSLNPIQKLTTQQYENSQTTSQYLQSNTLNIKQTSINNQISLKLPQIQKQRSMSEEFNLKRQYSNHHVSFKKLRSQSGFVSQNQLQKQLIKPQFNSSTCNTSINSKRTSLPIITQIQGSNMHQNKNLQNQQQIVGNISEKFNQSYNVMNTEVPCTEKLSKLIDLCGKSQTKRQQVYSHKKQKDNQQTILFTKYQMLPFKPRNRATTTTGYDFIQKTDSYKIKDNIVNNLNYTEISEIQAYKNQGERNQFLYKPQDNIENEMNQKSICNRIDKNFALSLKRLQFDKHFPDNALTKQMQTYYETNNNIQEYKKYVNKVDVPMNSQILLSLINNLHQQEQQFSDKYKIQYNFKIDNNIK